MCEKALTLWTLQSPDFKLSSGRVDHGKSKYYLTVNGVKEAYSELWKRLDISDGQIVWCYTNAEGIVKTGIREIRWELQVPREKIICFIDDLVWNRILGIKCGVGPNMRRQWIMKAVRCCPANSPVYVKKLEDEFWNRQPATGSWWDELFVENIGESVSAIIYHPVPIEYVVDNEIWCCDERLLF